MRKLIVLLIAFFAFTTTNAQEINALITVNSDQISGSNKQVFTTLQTSITEFINQTKWTDKNFKPQERVNCAFTITINKQANSNRFEASLQIQAARPVYGTSYTTPIINISDSDFNFKYDEFQPFNYNENSFESNLISTIVFYVHVILGVDADTFKLNGGDSYYKKAKDVMLLAQQSGGAGWQDQVGQQNRFTLIDNLTSTKLTTFKNIVYNYHRLGMDVFSKDKGKAKSTIERSVLQLESLYNKVIGNQIIRFFLDAKADEIATMFSDGPRTSNASRMQTLLQRISPTNNDKWQKIK
ncbi:MAG: DUF4835 family protein [Polaribacter sp.]|jgi:hypothetical protein|nr:DUF4835 family protein [Polaribacter sp.]MDG1953391.1 DUF4835 family protein [Polaribacter sp.]